LKPNIHSSPKSKTTTSSLHSSTEKTLNEASVHDRIKITSSIAKSERRANERLSASYAREICSGCKRPTSICLCESLPESTIDTHTQILILQHPTEFKRKTISTVPLIPLVLKNCEIKIGYQFKEDDLLKIDSIQQALERGEKPLLLFPGANSLDLNDIFDSDNRNEIAPSPSSSTALSSPSTSSKSTTTPKLSRLLIFIDGTWSQAKRTARESPYLLSICQKVQFTTKGNSIYNAIRREPQDHYVSTLECCAQALCLIENSKKTRMASDYLLKALASLVNQQLDIRSQPGSTPRFVKPSERYKEKHSQRRLEIEMDLFQSQTKENPSIRKIPPTEKPKHILTKKRIRRLQDGSTLRPLRHSDAPLINAIIPRCQSTKSLQQITRQIALQQQHPANLGIFRGHDLCGCILQYENGVLGMLYVLPAYQNLGYGNLLVQTATEYLIDNDMECSCYILDGNSVSEHVFEKHGWEKADPNQKKRTGRRRAPRLWVRKLLQKKGEI